MTLVTPTPGVGARLPELAAPASGDGRGKVRVGAGEPVRSHHRLDALSGLGPAPSLAGRVQLFQAFQSTVHVRYVLFQSFQPLAHPPNRRGRAG